MAALALAAVMVVSQMALLTTTNRRGVWGGLGLGILVHLQPTRLDFLD
jgi:hypothetical protein